MIQLYCIQPVLLIGGEDRDSGDTGAGSECIRAYGSETITQMTRNRSTAPACDQHPPLPCRTCLLLSLSHPHPLSPFCTPNTTMSAGRGYEVFVHGIPWTFSKRELSKYCSQFGKVLSTHVTFVSNSSHSFVSPLLTSPCSRTKKPACTMATALSTSGPRMRSAT